MKSGPASGGASGGGLGAAALASGAFLLVPLAAIAVTGLAGGWSTLASVARVSLAESLADTLLLLAGVTLCAGSMGYVTAWLVAAFRFPGRDVLAFALVLPLAIPTYVAAYVAVELLDPLGPVQSAFRSLFGYTRRAEYWFPEIRSLPGAVLVLSFVLFPYIHLPVRALLTRRSASLSEAARSLGAGPFTHLRRIAFPLARPAMAAGLTLALLETLNDIGASQHLGVQTFTVSIFDTWLNRGSLAGAAQLAMFATVAVLAILSLEARARQDKRYAVPVRRPHLARGVRLAGWRAALAFGLCLMPVAIGFAVPVGFLALEALRVLRTAGWPAELAAEIGHTALYAAAASVLAVVLGVAASLAARLLRRRRFVLAKRFLSLGYALPGTVLALGLLVPFAAIDGFVAPLLRDGLGLPPRQWLIGSGIAVVLALVARFSSIVVATVDAGLERISPRIDEAARSLGASAAKVRKAVLTPLLRPSIAGAAILVFVDAVKELPATLLLRPLGVETLATSLYGHAARGRFEDGAVQALLILAVALVPVMRLAGLMDRLPAGTDRRGPDPLAAPT